MKKRLIILFLAPFFISVAAYAQNKALDKLEMLYDQGHYAMVYRRASNLLDKPDYDFSVQPEFYKSLAMFRLSEKEFWAQMHPDALQEARKLFLDVKSTPEGVKVFNAHLNHVIALRKYLVERVEYYRKNGNKDKYDELQQILFGLFDNIPEMDNPSGVKSPTNPETTETEIAETVEIRKKRELIVETAKKQLGVPYLWAGTDPNGFDCSGFTSFVMNDQKIAIPRRAEDQYTASTKIKQRSAQKGDFIFFNNGSGVSHVGIVISEKGAPLTMIHASSSKGITITNIEESEYWLKRIYGFGTFITK
jgi:cell wall-associated NlpC family hydrolase